MSEDEAAGIGLGSGKRVLVVLSCDNLHVGVLLHLGQEALLAQVRGGNTLEHVDHGDRALVIVELGDGVGRGLAALVVVRADRRGEDRCVL